MEKYKIDRINELARKSKVQALNEDEKLEQKSLRDEYIAEMKQSLKASLNNVYIKDEDGREVKLKKKNKSENCQKN